jgi:hypothetical protein
MQGSGKDNGKEITMVQVFKIKTWTIKKFNCSRNVLTTLMPYGLTILIQLLI